MTVGKNLQLSLPVHKLEFETADDVANVFKLNYDWMAVLTGHEAKDVYQSTHAFMTDSASEMGTFQPLLQEKLLSDHQPFGLKCVQHTVTGYTETMLKAISGLEQEIGPEKLYGTANCHDKSNVTKETIVAVCKLISPQYQNKPYSMRPEFEVMLSENGGLKKNDSFSFRNHRFGCLSKAAAMILYHLDDVVHLCDHVESRNDLIIFIRTMLDCEFVKHVIIALSLVGLHLIEPFTELVSTSNHLELQVAFKSLFKDLQKSGQVANGVFNFSKAAIPSLQSLLEKVIEKNVYPNHWLDVLQVQIDSLDDGGFETVSHVVGLFAHHCAATLQHQRGEAYGFAATIGPHAGNL